MVVLIIQILVFLKQIYSIFIPAQHFKRFRGFEHLKQTELIILQQPFKRHITLIGSVMCIPLNNTSCRNILPRKFIIGQFLKTSLLVEWINLKPVKEIEVVIIYLIMKKPRSFHPFGSFN